MTLTKQSRRCWCWNSNLRSKQGELEPLWTSVKRSSLRPVLNDTKISVGCCAINPSPGKYIQTTEKTIENSEVVCATRVLLNAVWFCRINIIIIPPNEAIWPHMPTTAFSIFFTRLRVNTENHFRFCWQRGLWSCPHSLYNWVHCSESFRQDLQFAIGYIVQSWPRVARQHHLQADKIWNEYLIQQKSSNEVVECLTSVPLNKSSLTKGITPRMMSTPLLSTKNKAHLWGGPWKRKRHRSLSHKQGFHSIFFLKVQTVVRWQLPKI